MRFLFKNKWYLMITLFSLFLLISSVATLPKGFIEDLREAQAYVKSGELLQASRSYFNAAQKKALDIHLWELAAYYSLVGGDPDTAIIHLENFAPDGNEHPQLSQTGLIVLARAYLQMKEYDNALNFFQISEEMYGLSEDILKYRAEAYLAQGNIQKAIINLTFLEQLNSNDWQVNYTLGLLLATQDPLSAIAPLKKAADLNTDTKKDAEKLIQAIQSTRYFEDSAYSLLSSGRALASINRWDLAAEAFRQAIIKNSGYADAWAFLGEAYQHLDKGSIQQNRSDGLNEILTAISINPDSLAAYTILSNYWKRKGHFDLAEEAIQKAIEKDDNNPILYSELANIQASSGDFENAYLSYLESFALSPNSPIYRQQIIEFSLVYNYQISEIALPLARRLVIEFPLDAISHDLMAQVLIELGDLALAERFLENALKIDPNLVQAHIHRGILFALTSRREEAYNEFKVSLSLISDPNDPMADQVHRLLEIYFP
jgi:tetratricopeptide (TPR) repeat protein